jgi:hypothetical protein
VRGEKQQHISPLTITHNILHYASACHAENFWHLQWDEHRRCHLKIININKRFFGFGGQEYIRVFSLHIQHKHSHLMRLKICFCRIIYVETIFISAMQRGKFIQQIKRYFEVLQIFIESWGTRRVRVEGTV